MKQFIKYLIEDFIKTHADLLIKVIWGDFWKLRSVIEKGGKRKVAFKKIIYFSYLEKYGAWIGIGAKFDDIPTFPHGLSGIFISNQAHIGKNVVIMHQVTIGSNTTIGSKHNGSPTIENGVFIGAGAKIIGKITVGENSRIGANAVVVKDTPPNSVTILRNIESIIKKTELDNRWVNMFANGIEKINLK